MNIIRFKIWRDLWNNKARTLQVVLIIGLGAAALGMIVGTHNLLAESIASSWQAINPPMIGLRADPPVNDNTIASLALIEGLEGVEGSILTNIQWRLSEEQEWRPAGLVARNDYSNQQYNKISLLNGAWPENNALAIEDSAVNVFGVEEGGQLQIQINNQEYVVDIAGVVNDELAHPPNIGGKPQLYITRDSLRELSGIEGFNVILARATNYDREKVTEMATEMQNSLEEQNVRSGGFLPPSFNRVVDPNRHLFQDILDAIFLVLGVMAVFALILSLFLVYNTISAIISRQTDQIGVMKAIGARTWQILLVYLLTVLTISVMALLISLPLGALGGWVLTVFLSGAFNADPGSFTVSIPAVQVQVAVAVIAPLLAAAIPVISGSRITVNQAINTYGLSVKPTLLDRAFSRTKRVPRLLVLMFTNTFRRKGRVVLTQITLVLSGLIFMMVMGARDSAAYTFNEVMFSILDFNVHFLFEEPESIDQIEEMTLAHPEVKAAEMWGLNSGTLRLQGEPPTFDDAGVGFFGVPLPTELYGPRMKSGRWLLPEDTNAVVLNHKLAQNAGVDIGDWVTVDHGPSGEVDWLVVGILSEVTSPNSAYVSRDVLLGEIGREGQAGSIWIQTVNEDPASEVAAEKSLRAYYKERGIEIDPAGIFEANTSSGTKTQILNNFGIIISLLLVMAITIGIVGSIGLSGALSLNVLERSREIGVMRAVGASNRSVSWLFIGEGLVLGLLSWLIALPLSIPAGQLLVQAIGQAINNELVYQFTPLGAQVWLVIIIIFSIAASWLPARRAVRVSVRQSLAYQ